MSKKYETDALLFDDNPQPTKRKCCTKHTAIVAFSSSLVTLVICAAAVGIHLLLVTSKQKPTCSGNGVFYEETGCECHLCFSGSDCSTTIVDCVINANSGEPYLFQELWIKHAKNMDPIETSYDYRLPYGFYLSRLLTNSVNTTLAGVLNSQIRRLHKKFNNFNVTDDHFIVLTSGGTQALHAALFAQIYSSPEKQATVFAKAPYYSAYSYLCQITNCTFSSSAQDIDDNNNVIEYITSPNNPDGYIRNRTFTNSTALFDLVYYWPHLTSDPVVPVDGDIGLFSLTKFAGLAGTRFGWLVFKKRELAELALAFVQSNNLHVSVDAAHRAYHAFNYFLSDAGDGFVSEVQTILRGRWKDMLEIIPDPKYNLPFTIVGAPNTFYMWLQCTKLQVGQRCDEVLREYGVIVRDGSEFGSPGFARIPLTFHEKTYQLFLQYLKTGKKDF